MKEMHHFSLKNDTALCYSLDGWSLHLYLAQKEYRGTIARVDVNNWLSKNEITNVVEFAPIEYRNELGQLKAYESACYAFYNELDALQFKLVFADLFDYEIYDAD